MLKIKVLGCVLLAIGVATAFLAMGLGFELAPFYIVISVIGVMMFLYGRFWSR